ncbi:MAG: hypothetical protein QNI89_07240 [Desulfobacterales bacterium]|nr:hypothetical protein [Desulfobacterales bacterium]MDJ0887073.1 hypothetical protein [Desulfobacterales bacterium]
MDPAAPYGCREYRQEMILVALHERLRREDLPDEERHALEAEIRRLEEERFG